MAPKKSSRSALYYYALECMENKTCRSANIKDAIEAVYTAWKSLSPIEKMPYETRYDHWKQSIKEEPTQLVVKNSLKLEDVTMADTQIVESKLEILVKSLQRENKVTTQSFFFIKFQSFCKCDKFNDVNLNYRYSPYYVLAEVAVIEYSLTDGIKRQYHSFIKPNKIPLGYRSQCMDTARDVLGEMPIDGFDQAKKAYQKIYKEIEVFIGSNGDENNNSNKMTVYCLSKDIAETKFGLQFLYDRTIETLQTEPPTRLIEQVYDLEILVNKLGKLKINDFYSANEILTSYAFDYALGSRCQWHEDKGALNCSLGITKKYCYLISDTLCQLFNIKLTENHLPIQESVGTVLKSADFGQRTTYRDRRNRANDSRNDSTSFRSEKSEKYSRNDYANRSNVYEEEDDVQYQDSEDTQSTSIYSYPTKRNASDNFKYPSTDIRFERSMTSQSIVTQTSIQSRIPSIYESKSSEPEVPPGLFEDEDEDGWVTKPAYKSRNINQDTKSVVSTTSNGNDLVVSGTSKTSSFKYQGRGKLVKRN